VTHDIVTGAYQLLPGESANIDEIIVDVGDAPLQVGLRDDHRGFEQLFFDAGNGIILFQTFGPSLFDVQTMEMCCSLATGLHLLSGIPPDS